MPGRRREGGREREGGDRCQEEEGGREGGDRCQAGGEREGGRG